jgi:hypothetical protein
MWLVTLCDMFPSYCQEACLWWRYCSGTCCGRDIWEGGGGNCCWLRGMTVWLAQHNEGWGMQMTIPSFPFAGLYVKWAQNTRVIRRYSSGLNMKTDPHFQFENFHFFMCYTLYSVKVCTAVHSTQNWFLINNSCRFNFCFTPSAALFIYFMWHSYENFGCQLQGERLVFFFCSG